MTMRLQLLYVHDRAIGYGRYGAKLHEALTARGVTIHDTLEPGERDPANVVCWVSVPTHARGWHQGQHVVISTMWETTSLPESFRRTLHNFDQILVPSDQNVELFSRYHDNVRKVPLGIDTDEWGFRERTPPEDRFVFLIGGSGARKGVDLAYQAFRKVFRTWPSDMPTPTLIFKSPKPVDYYGERIERIGGHISSQAERDLYAMAHCYLQPSRGEGWGLQPLQAIAQGCPTILTDAHGHAEFAYLGYGLSTTFTQSDYFIYGPAGDWWEPSLDDLCQQMEYVYHHYDEACEFARMSSKVAHDRFTWNNSAEAFVRAVGARRLEKAYSGDRSWAVPSERLYPVRVVKPHRAEICGVVYQFHPGETTWERADVKRILSEAGVLDLTLVASSDEEAARHNTGLSEEQVRQMGAVSASEHHCWECGQKLNIGERYDPPL